MIEGAKNIDFNASYFKEEMAKLDRNAAVMVYCKSGQYFLMLAIGKNLYKLS